MIKISAAKHPLLCSIELPSDKSIAHRRLLLASLFSQPIDLTIYRCGADLYSTLFALERLSVSTDCIQIDQYHSTFRIIGPIGKHQPTVPINCANSGTTCRLLMGVLAGKSVTAELTGDQSLSNRPMDRIADPLRLMGAQITTTDGKLPVNIHPSLLHGIRYRMPIASAQLKSALLFAGLHADGYTEIIEPVPSRDHTERLLQLTPTQVDNVTSWRVSRDTTIPIPDGIIPGDPSSGAFWTTIALLVPGSALVLESVGINPSRIEFYRQLMLAGAKITIEQQSTSNGEPIGIISVTSGGHFSFDINGGSVPYLIDELPILAIVAAGSGGRFQLRDAQELRLKECDRILALVAGLRAMGVSCEEYNDGFAFEATKRLHGSKIDCMNDHRIAMSFAVASLVAKGETTLVNATAVDVSYPGFFEELSEKLGVVS